MAQIQHEQCRVSRTGPLGRGGAYRLPAGQAGD